MFYSSENNDFYKLLDDVFSTDDFKKLKKNLINNKKNRKEIIRKFKDKFKKYNITICDIFETADFKKENSSYDKDIDLDSPDTKYNDKEIANILINSNIQRIATTSKFVTDLVTNIIRFPKSSYLILIKNKGDIRTLISPTARRRKSKDYTEEDRINDRKEKLTIIKKF